MHRRPPVLTFAFLSFLACFATGPFTVLAGLEAVGHEFRPTAAERAGVNECTDDDGVTARVRWVCDVPYGDGSCEDYYDGRLLIDWRAADGTVQAGPFDLEAYYGAPAVACARDGSVLVAHDGQVRAVDRNGPRGPWTSFCGDAYPYSCWAETAGVAATREDFVVAWPGGWMPVQARFFDREGRGVAEPFEFGGDATWVHEVSAAADDDGSIVVGWRDTNPRTSWLEEVHAVHVTKDGAEGPAVVVTEFPYAEHHRLGVAAAADGSFVISWRNAMSQGGWVARRVRAGVDGAPTTTTSTTTTTLDESAPSFYPGETLAAYEPDIYSGDPPSLAADMGGRWLASWADYFRGDPLDGWGPRFSSSANDGARWSAMDAGIAEPFGASQTTPIATDGDGVWVIPWTRAEGPGVDLRRSTNNGKTWHAAGFLSDVVFAWGPGWGGWTIGGVRIAASRTSGRWVAAWASVLREDERYDPSGNPYNVPFDCAVRTALSTDRAQTWRQSKTVAYVPCNVNDLELATDSAGNWLVVWGANRRVHGSRSADDGGTWSVAKTLLEHARPSLASLSLAANTDGTWLLAFDAEPGPDVESISTRVFVSRTTDLAGAWSDPAGVAPWHVDEGGRDFEASLAAGAAGEWGLAWTSHSGAGGSSLDADVVAAFSSDGGRTWSAARPVDFHAPRDQRTDFAPQLAYSNGTWGVLWKSRETPEHYSPIGDATIRFARTSGGCGDGRVEAGEECDDGNLHDGDGCDSTCRPTGCGSGAVTAGEECDDADTDDGDECVSTCRLARCGDGVTRALWEACDDANDVETDACRNDCSLPVCGDGVVFDGVEECDDGNASPEDACLPTCEAARCGDGYVGIGLEHCDDGNLADGDRCTSGCRLDPVCGAGTFGSQRATATDALRVLRKAVGIATRCPVKRCDADGDGRVTAVDALRTLRLAVGQLVAGGCGETRTLVLRLASEVSLAALQVIFDYSRMPGDLLGELAKVRGANGEASCELLFDPTLWAAHWDPGRGHFTVGMISLVEFAGPLDLVRCEYRASRDPVPEDFAFTLQDATDDDGNQIEPWPTVEVVLD